MNLLAELIRLAAFLGVFFPNPGTQDVLIDRNVIYKVVQARPLPVNLFRPENPPEATPAVVVVHGGAWVWGFKKDYPDFARHFVQNGIACIAVGYRRNPPDGFTGQVNDVKDAIRWVRRHAADYQIDPDRIGLFGSSAGGHLAGLAGLSGNGEGFSNDRNGESSEVKALFLLYGAYDPGETAPNPIIRYFAGGFWPDEAPEVFDFYSLKAHVDGSESPTFILHGDDDRTVPLELAEALVSTLREADVPVEYVTVPGLAHGFAKVAPWTRPMVFDHMLDFYQRRL